MARRGGLDHGCDDGHDFTVMGGGLEVPSFPHGDEEDCPRPLYDAPENILTNVHQEVGNVVTDW